ncbi:LysR substrate-binding domain-containing protein [Streptomyces chrestomyceticus]|uniref:LysR substrate-binding domain-containing protein n=1 Tax=Streptomyces chrestomyceticus TaxID=68185 RepID=UPI0036B11CE7
MAIGEELSGYDFTGPRTEVVRTGRGLGMAVNEAHPPASRDEAHVDALAQEAWIVGAGREGDPEFGAWPALEAPRLAHEASGRQTRLGLVAPGLGVSVLPGLAADSVPPGVKWLHIEDPALVPKRETLMVTDADTAAGARTTLQALRDECTARAAGPATSPHTDRVRPSSTVNQALPAPSQT